MLTLNLPFAWLVKRMPRARFVPLTYRFFALNILGFAAALYLAPPEWDVWIGRVFFIWLSIFNLFVVSIFWATIVDVFTNEQGRRLFGFIAAGATLGAIAGSATTAALATNVPTWGLMLCAVVLLEGAVFSMRGLARLARQLHEVPGSGTAGEARDSAIGGSIWAGITRTLASPYLLNISLFLLLFSITSTFLYFEQAGIAKRSFPDRASQTAFFAGVDLAVNVLTLGVQLFLTGRIVGRIGVGATLAILPAFSILGFAALAFAPTIAVIVAFQVLRRAGNFAIARPIREVLFTVVPGRTATRPRASSTRWSIASATRRGRGPSPGSARWDSGRPACPARRCRSRSPGSSTACGSDGRRSGGGRGQRPRTRSRPSTPSPLCGGGTIVISRQACPDLRNPHRECSQMSLA